MYPLIRKILFQSDAEFVHQLGIRFFHTLGLFPGLCDRLRKTATKEGGKPVYAFGLKFANKVGLAAGFDKDGVAWRGLSAIGFGHIEIGTVTLAAQSGNPKPRIFRYPKQQAIINRMGFPGKGSQYVLTQLSKKKRKPNSNLVLGINIGKNKNTPNQNAVNEYVKLFNLFAGTADYIAINVSSPNTIGLRRLQARNQLEILCKELTATRNAYHKQHDKLVPLLLKISPDLNDEDIADIVEVVMQTGIDGIIATNTTISRPDNRSHWEEGGLSGKPLFERSLEVIRKINSITNATLPVIGVGGIFSYDDAQRMLDAGAVLVQTYTGFVYNGPGFIKILIRNL